MKTLHLSIIIILVLGNSAVFAQNVTSSQSSDCTTQINNEKKSIMDNINQNKAVSLAENTLYYKSNATNYNPHFDYAYYKWTVSNCDVKLNSVNLVFDFLFKNIPPCGAKQIVFVEDPNLNSVADIIDAGTTYSPYCPLIPNNSPGNIQNNAMILEENITASRHPAHISSIRDSPLKQFKSGISAENVQCNTNLVLIFKIEDSSPACVRPQTARILMERGWTPVAPTIGSANASVRQAQIAPCTYQSTNQTIVPRIALPPCPAGFYHFNTNVIAYSGFAEVNGYSSIISDYVLKPGHNGTMTYTISASPPNFAIPDNMPSQYNVTNYAIFFHTKTIPLDHISNYPEVKKESNSGTPYYATCYALPRSNGQSCSGAQPSNGSVSLYFYDHPGVNVSFDKRSETIGPHGSVTVTMTISVLPDAPTGTYWVEVSPPICTGGLFLLLTVGDCPYSGGAN